VSAYVGSSKNPQDLKDPQERGAPLGLGKAQRYFPLFALDGYYPPLGLGGAEGVDAVQDLHSGSGLRVQDSVQGYLAHKNPPPQDHHKALGMVLLKCPRGVRFLVSEVLL